MTRVYLVAPAGTSLLEVEASSPGFALSKAAKGHAELVDVGRGLVVAMSRTRRRLNGGQAPIPGQLDLHGGEVQA